MSNIVLHQITFDNYCENSYPNILLVQSFMDIERLETEKLSPRIKTLISILSAAILTVLSGCTQVRYAKLNVSCSHPEKNTMCLTGDIDHECTEKMLKKWAKECKKTEIFRKNTRTKCIRCLD